MELVDLQSMRFYSLGIRFLVGLDYFLQSFMLKKFGFLLGLVDLLSRFPILETSFSQGIYFFFLLFLLNSNEMKNRAAMKRMASQTQRNSG